MLFSVVIPLYNKADTIERTIRSVWAQSFKDYELIVVNDGSTDCSLDVVKRLSQNIPIQIIDKPNGGVSSARNAGAVVAKGKFIALLDGDDIWFPSHLALLADAIEKHPEVRLLGSGYERVLEKHKYYTIPWGGCCVRDVYLAFRYGQPVHTSTVVIDRLLWLEIGGFDSQYSFYEDYEFFFRLGVFTKCCIVRKVSGQYMDDASVQATKIKRSVSRMTRPHLSFIDDMICKGMATREMIAYANTQFTLLIYKLGKNMDSEGVRHVLREFPHIAKRQRLASCDGRLHGLRYKLYMNFFIIVYKIRCHLITWRKHV